MVQTDASISEQDTSPYIIKRRLNAVIRGSLTQFANAGQEAACWSTQNGRINDIMGINELIDGTGDQASATALLQNAKTSVSPINLFSSLPTLRHPREAARAEFFEFVLEAKLPKFENVFLVPSGKIC